MFSLTPSDRYAVFIDGANFHATTRTLGFEVDFEKLLNAFKSEGRLVRAYYYTALPDGTDYAPVRRLADWLDYNGFTMVTKQTREYTDQETGRRRMKGNMDMELALDMMKLAPHIEHAMLFSGDGDFCRLLEEVQSQGIRTTVVSTLATKPPMLSDALRRQADGFIEIDTLKEQISRPPRENDSERGESQSQQGAEEFLAATPGGDSAQVLEDRRQRR